MRPETEILGGCLMYPVHPIAVAALLMAYNVRYEEVIQNAHYRDLDWNLFSQKKTIFISKISIAGHRSITQAISLLYEIGTHGYRGTAFNTYPIHHDPFPNSAARIYDLEKQGELGRGYIAKNLNWFKR